MISTSRIFRMSIMLAISIGACHACRENEPFPPHFDFRIAPDSGTARELREKQEFLVNGGPAAARLVAAQCAATFNAVVVGDYCSKAIERCCGGACAPAEMKVACTAQRAPALSRHCCDEAFAGFLSNMPVCDGMRVQDCVVYSTDAGPRGIP